MATKKAKNVDMTVVQIIPLDILSSFLCLCIISFSAIFIILSAAPGTIGHILPNLPVVVMVRKRYVVLL